MAELCRKNAHPPVGCVIMASGLARRFGSNKLLADFGGRPLLCRALEVTATPALAARVVVTRSAEVKALCDAQAVPRPGGGCNARPPQPAGPERHCPAGAGGVAGAMPQPCRLHLPAWRSAPAAAGDAGSADHCFCPDTKRNRAGDLPAGSPGRTWPGHRCRKSRSVWMRIFSRSAHPARGQGRQCCAQGSP